jgi:hypothetical protein
MQDCLSPVTPLAGTLSCETAGRKQQLVQLKNDGFVPVLSCSHTGMSFAGQREVARERDNCVRVETRIGAKNWWHGLVSCDAQV